MKKQMTSNNKGFSLIELIVVIAIMAILAVTLAPRLMHYVEKANKASDQEAVNTIYTAAKLAYAQYPAGFTSLATSGTWVIGAADDTTLYKTTDGKTWNLSTFKDADANKNNEFLKEMVKILKDFKLKSSDCGTSTNITINVTGSVLKVTLDYDGSGASAVPTIEAAE